MWDHRIETEGFMAAAEMFRNAARGMKDHALTGPEPVAQIPELVERGRMRVGRFFDTLDAQLDGREFVTGSSYTVADITALVAVDFINRLKVFLQARLFLEQFLVGRFIEYIVIVEQGVQCNGQRGFGIVHHFSRDCLVFCQ